MWICGLGGLEIESRPVTVCRIWPRAEGLQEQLFSGEAIRIELDERRCLPVSICRLRPSRLGLVLGSLAVTDEDGQTSGLVQGAFA